ncbi:MAG TPA: amino acid ABC transporter permease [Candidatus Marinimicrobia bacterium]|nr:amino acid ABC transporter permease [Candidatus Neomarinimicrobiota bacterium]HIO82370.1 amino acid ABC transporter permease [Candidatus Poribacteria bacterium]
MNRHLPWWHSKWFDVLQFLILSGGLVWITYRGAAAMDYRWQWYRVPRMFYRFIDGELIWGPLVNGLLVTLEIAAWSMLFTLIIGLVTTFLRLSDSLAGRVLARAYLEVVRNTPLLVQVSIFYFVLQPILGFNSPIWAGIICLSFYEGAFASEIIRAGILSVERGQWEAGSSIGLSRTQAYRYVILPQAVPLMLPPMAGILINLIKHSAILSFVAVFELTTEARNLVSDTFMSFEVWFVIGPMYLVLTISLSAVVAYLERRVRRPA